MDHKIDLLAGMTVSVNDEGARNRIPARQKASSAMASI